MPVCIGHEVSSSSRLLFFFFFQAEDGIRDVAVTGVQTCALPILLYVAEDREQSSLDGFWSTITAEQRASIEAVALDMWDPYLASLQNHLPAAEEKIVFDKRSEEHTSELQSRLHLVCRLLLEKKKKK